MRKFVCIALVLLPLITKENVIDRKRIDDSIERERLYEGLNQFKRLLGLAESNHNPKAIGRNYYLGTYQIGKEAAKDVSVPYDSLLIQKWNDTAVVRYMRVNWKYLESYHRFEGHIIRGVKITKAGMLAGAHLKGHLWVKKYLDSNGAINGKDPNGKSVEDYIKLMQNVNLIKF